eukprot:123346-Chlamydomonas_euryale.AAC.2
MLRPHPHTPAAPAFHVHVAVAEPFRLAQPNPVNNGCVIKFVGQHGIVRPQQRLEEPCRKAWKEGAVGASTRD